MTADINTDKTDENRGPEDIYDVINDAADKDRLYAVSSRYAREFLAYATVTITSVIAFAWAVFAGWSVSIGLAFAWGFVTAYALARACSKAMACGFTYGAYRHGLH